MLIERYQELESFGFSPEEKFLYGSHYSSPGLVLHFMVRQEPFTSMAIDLQSGKFDCPDRLFFDLKECWKSCNTSSSDVKELIPGMFLPHVFPKRIEISCSIIICLNSYFLSLQSFLPCQKCFRTRTAFLWVQHKGEYVSMMSLCPHGRKGQHMNLYVYIDLHWSLNMYPAICKTGSIWYSDTSNEGSKLRRHGTVSTFIFNHVRLNCHVDTHDFMIYRQYSFPNDIHCDEK